MTFPLLFCSFFILLLMGVPIAVALILSSALVISFLPHLNYEFIVQGFVSSLDSFPLLAVLLFTLTGNLMIYLGV
ncbi:MAG: TRAP transporter large permease subunit, partial [Cellvibrionales bacterium]|nr:TRAP transporter large permease subunit [Cellvibrionales bacterium]